MLARRQKPMTFSTPARLYQLRSKMMISPAAGKSRMYRCMNICDFSRSEGRGKRNNAKHPRADALGNSLDRAAFARRIASLEDDDDSQAFRLDPFLDVAESDLKLAQRLFVGLALHLAVLRVGFLPGLVLGFLHRSARCLVRKPQRCGHSPRRTTIHSFSALDLSVAPAAQRPVSLVAFWATALKGGIDDHPIPACRRPFPELWSDEEPTGRSAAAKWSWLPPIRWLGGYRSAWLSSDIIAGVTLAAYAIPVSLAYAALAGLPPQVGIYGYLLGGLGYALLGSSRQLAIGPTSAISLMIAGNRRCDGGRRCGALRADREPCGVHRGGSLPACLAVPAERAGDSDQRQHPGRLQDRRRTDDRDDAVAETVRRGRRRS